MVIKRGENITVAVVTPTGQQTMQAMGANIVDMEFVLNFSVEFKLGDWCEVYGNRYYINILPEVEKLNNRHYSYRVQMEHEYYKLQNVILMNKDNEDNFTSSEFAFYGTANEVMSLLLQNANRVYSGWVLGSIKTTERKLFNFNGENLLQAINIIAESFDTEYWIEGKQISLDNRVSTTGVTLSYGENKGLKSISKVNKENKSIFTRLYVLGGNRNIIPTQYRNNSLRLRMPAVYGDFIEDADKVAQYGVIEAKKIFEDIYPQRVGTITAIHQSYFEFTDSSLDFDINTQLIPGTTAKVHFLSGDLQGYDFEISNYNNTEKKISFNKNKDEKVIELPSENYKPKIGDRYMLLDIIMPETYVLAKEEELKNKAIEYYNTETNPEYNNRYIVDCDPLYFKRNSIELQLGYAINLIDSHLGIDVVKRIETIKRDLQDAYDYELELSDNIKVNGEVINYIKVKEFENYIKENIYQNGVDIKNIASKIPITWELIPISDKQVHAFNYDATGTLNTLEYSVKFMRGGKDVTTIMQQSGLNLYNFERKNTYGFDDNNISDASWNAAHVGKKTVTLTDKDIYAVGTLEVVYDETILENEYKILTNGN